MTDWEDSSTARGGADPLAEYLPYFQRRREARVRDIEVAPAAAAALLRRAVERAQLGEEPEPAAVVIEPLRPPLLRDRWASWLEPLTWAQRLALGGAFGVVVASLLLAVRPSDPGAGGAPPVVLHFAQMDATRSGTSDGDPVLLLSVIENRVELEIMEFVFLQGAVIPGLAGRWRIDASGTNRAGMPARFAGDLSFEAPADTLNSALADAHQFHPVTLLGKLTLGTNPPSELSFVSIRKPTARHRQSPLSTNDAQ